VKPDVDRLLTVPDDPPAAGPDRTLDPPLPDPVPAAPPPAGTECAADAEEDAADAEEDAAVEADDAAVAEEDGVQPATSPISPQPTAATTIRPRRRPGGTRHACQRRACWAMVDTGPVGWVSWIASSLTVMIALLRLRYLYRRLPPPGEGFLRRLTRLAPLASSFVARSRNVVAASTQFDYRQAGIRGFQLAADINAGGSNVAKPLTPPPEESRQARY
jgi:hypothetical protein